jgi:hypothetical protein
MANRNNPDGKFKPPSSREHAPAGKGQTVGGVHSAGPLANTRMPMKMKMSGKQQMPMKGKQSAA